MTWENLKYENKIGKVFKPDFFPKLRFSFTLNIILLWPFIPAKLAMNKKNRKAVEIQLRSGFLSWRGMQRGHHGPPVLPWWFTQAWQAGSHYTSWTLLLYRAETKSGELCRSKARREWTPWSQWLATRQGVRFVCGMGARFRTSSNHCDHVRVTVDENHHSPH